MSYQAMRRHGGNLHAYHLVKEANLANLQSGQDSLGAAHFCCPGHQPNQL